MTPIKFRRTEEDFRKIDALHYVADNHGLRIMSFDKGKDTDWGITYFKPTQAGKEPKLDECRDEQDYQFKIEAWIKKGKVQSRWYHSFEDMVSGEIERLKNGIE